MTSIEEKEYDKKIIVSGQKFTCDDVDDTIPPPLPQKGGFAMLIIGKPGMGKTSLILSLVCKSGKAFNRKFDKVFVWSPSLITMAEDPFELIPEDQKFEEATLENIQGALDEIKDTGLKYLWIFDDVIADVRGKGKAQIENLLQKIFFNRRHLAGAGGSLSIIATSQTYNRYVYDKKHNFIYIDTSLPENKMIHKNFNQLIISSPNIMDYSLDQEDQ